MGDEDIVVHGERVWGGGKKGQNLLLLHPGKVDLQVLPWGTHCSRDKAPRTLSISLPDFLGGFTHVACTLIFVMFL